MPHKERIYFKFNYPGSLPGSKTLLTGIRGLGNRSITNDTLYITGFYESPSNQNTTGETTSFIYKGDLCGKNEISNWHILSYPSSDGVTVTSTNLYGPAILKDGFIRAVGNYSTEETGPSTIGCMYEGLLDGSGKWTTLIPTSDSPVLNTIAHSTHGDLVVGNYDTILIQGKAFIYDIRTGIYYDIIKPHECPSKVGIKSITAYGVWNNKGSHYTICGGFSRLNPTTGLDSAYLVDWNSKTHKFSNWRSYNYNNDNKGTAVTHFDGITSNDKGGYNLTGDAVLLDSNREVAFFAHVNCDNEAQWSQILYPDSSGTSGNSVYKSAVIGVYKIDTVPTDNGYISILI